MKPMSCEICQRGIEAPVVICARNAMLCIGCADGARRVIEGFLEAHTYAANRNPKAATAHSAAQAFDTKHQSEVKTWNAVEMWIHIDKDNKFLDEDGGSAA